MTGDTYSSPTLDQLAALGANEPGAARPVSFFERMRLGFKQGGNAPDWGYNQIRYESWAYGDIRRELEKRGHRLPGTGLVFSTFGSDELNFYAAGKSSNPALVTPEARRHFDAFWKAYADERARDPSFMADYGDVHDFATLQAHIAARRNDELRKVSEAAPDGLGVAGFVGEIGHGFTDPSSYIPVGKASEALSFGRRLLATSLREGAANIALTGAMEPLVRQDADRLGIERTTADFLTDLGVAGVAGAAIGGTFEAGRAVVEAATPLEYRVARELRNAEVPGAPELGMMDIDVARAFARAVPPEARTPEQQDALNVIARDAEIDASSPFVSGPAGDSANGQWLDMAMGQLSGEVPARRPQNAVTRETVAAGQADVSALRNPPREQLKARIHRAEATAANDYNPASGATGPYQFVARTWVSLFRRRYPGDKRSFDQVAALRRDPALNEVLMDDLIAENAAALRAAGLPETAGTLYLAHFLGHDRAVTVLRAAGDTPIGQLLPDSYFGDNPWLGRDWSAARLSQWAHTKMGGEAPTGLTNAGVEVVETPDPVDIPDVEVPAGRYDVEAMLGIAGDDRPILRPELFGSPEEHAAGQRRFEADRDAAEGFAPVRTSDELFSAGEHFDALRRYRGTVTAEAMAAELGITPDQLRRAVQSMQGLDRKSPFILARSRNAEPGALPDRVMRRPKRPAQQTSLVEFLAESGGLHDRGGELRGMDAHRWQQTKKFRKKAALVSDEGMALDDALMLAIENDYFPEFNGQRDPNGSINYDQLPDVQVLLDAIDAELRGKPRFGIEEAAPDPHAELEAQLARYGEEPDEPPPLGDAIVDYGAAEQAMFAAGDRGVRLDEDTLIEAANMIAGGRDIDEALDDAIVAAAYRDLEYAAAYTGDPLYATDNEGRRWSDDDINFAEPGEGAAAGRAAGGGGRRPEDPAGQAALDRAFAEQSAGGPEAEQFDDPVGPAAVSQADSLEHDLAMALEPPVEPGMVRVYHGGDDPNAGGGRWVSTNRQYAKDYREGHALSYVDLPENDPRVNNEDIPEQGVKQGFTFNFELTPAEAARLRQVETEGTYRLDDEGEEADLASILDEIEAARKSAAEMRACLKPAKGGDA